MDHSARTRCFLKAAAFALLLFLMRLAVPDAQAADGTAVAAARRLVETEYETVFFVMHPTGNLINVEYEGRAAADAGFILIYAFNFEGIFGSCYTKTRFHFDERGRFESLAAGASSSPSPPFFAAGLALDLLKKLVDEVADLKEDGIISEAIRKADVKATLERILILKQPFIRGTQSPLDEVSAAPGDGPAADDRELIELIGKTASMDAKERQEWLALLPRMTPAEREKLKNILLTEKRKLAELDQKYAEALARHDSRYSEMKELVNLISTAPGLSDDDRERLTAALLKMTEEQKRRLQRLLERALEEDVDAKTLLGKPGFAPQRIDCKTAAGSP